MSCSAYGMPAPYSAYPPVQNQFYYDQRGQSTPDSYNNITTQSWQDYNQLFRRNSLMPGSWQQGKAKGEAQFSMPVNGASDMPTSWNSVAAAQAMTSKHGKDDWSRYSVTEEGVQRYVASSGAIKYSLLSRSSAGRRFGVSNLLRSNPSPALSPSNTCQPFWYDSSDRQALVSPWMRPYVGCG